MPDLQHLAQAVHERIGPLPGRIPRAQAEAEVLLHVQVRKQRIVLGDVPHPPPLRQLVRDVPPIQMNAPSLESVKAQNALQQARLSTARRPQQDVIFPSAAREGDVGQRELPQADVQRFDACEGAVTGHRPVSFARRRESQTTWRSGS